MKNLKNMRPGFTMIELIFVIVIIGILAAIALPKLASTRDDAKTSNIVANTRTLLGDMESRYLGRGAIEWTTAATSEARLVTSVPALVATCGGDIIGQGTDNIKDVIVMCDAADATNGTECVTFDANDTHVTITPAALGDSEICDSVLAVPAFKGLAGTSTDPKIYALGGITVLRD